MPSVGAVVGIAAVPEAPGGERAATRLADELAGHLRALLRDMICGHLDADVHTLADELLAEAAAGAPG